MTHYQKLATMIFRSIGVIFLIIGGLAGLFSAFATAFGGAWGALIAIVYSLPTIIFGIVVFVLSKSAAKLICFDFNQPNE